MSTQSIASSSASSIDAPSRCATCGASIAGDQRYCLECGERQVPRSEFLRGASFAGGPPTQPPGVVVQATPSPSSRNNTISVIAGVGVLLLAMGVGVLIGRSAGAGKQSPAPAQVVSIASGTSGAAATPSTEASFTSDWPSGTSGYTVQLQTLPQAGTAVSAVEAAKTGATAKGAKGVGALESEEFSSLSAGSYVIYAGVDHKKGEAEKALASLKKSFPGAKVIKVSNSASGNAQSGGASGASKGGVGNSESKPAPPSVLESLKNTKGKSYEEKSKNLPDVVSTG